jgi:hypothetical protein
MTFNLCQYKNIFGAPGTGIHKYRIFNVAIVDVVATLLIAALITWIWYKKSPKKNKKHVGWVLLGVSVGLFILGVGAHRLFCVNTTIDKKLFDKQTACAPCGAHTPCKYQYPIRS